jgi:heptaprenyl diphosphate synthase
LNKIIKKENSKFRHSASIGRRIAFAGVFISLAIVLSVIENYFPIGLIIPVPGIKLGLANIVTVFAIVTLRPVDTIAIIVVRCLVMGLFTGPVSLLFSLSGAFLAFLVMKLLMLGIDRVFSIVGISMAGAVSHNIGQIIVAVVLLKDLKILLFYLPFLMLVSLVTGALVGIAAIPVIGKIRKLPHINKLPLVKNTPNM